MRTNRMFAGALGTFALALSLVSCSNEVDGPNVNTGNGESSAPHYMSISIAATPGSGTRAIDGDGTPEKAEYDNGQGNENKVDKVRFYFFKSGGEAIGVKQVTIDNNPTFVNYVEVIPEGNGTEPIGPVERVLSANIVITTNNDTDYPDAGNPGNNNGTIDDIDSMVAVINPDAVPNLGNGNLSLSGLEELVYAYTSENPFVMTNSVYKATANEESVKMVAVPVAGHIYPGPESAKNDPVTIYVERVLAKVSVDVDKTTVGAENNIITLSDGTIIYKAGETDSNNNDVYIKILGWNATATADRSNLIKNINPSWTDENLFKDWSYAPYFRSFWAMNPDKVTHQYGPFNTTNATNVATGKNLGGIVYVQENANEYSTAMSLAAPAKPTQVIIAGQLVDNKGNAIDIAEWGFEKYTNDGAKDAMLSNVNLYTKTSGTGEDTYTPITKDYVDFKTASEVVYESENTDKVWDATKVENLIQVGGRYYVYLQLKDDINPAELYTKVFDTESKEYKYQKATSTANQILKDLGRAKVWEGGFTYWYADIKHLGTPNNVGGIGVVRNHSYKVNINALSGLGTPVYNPGEVIIPEKPTDDDSYIAARVKVLSWRVVSNDYKFEW